MSKRAKFMLLALMATPVLFGGGCATFHKLFIHVSNLTQFFAALRTLGAA